MLKRLSVLPLLLVVLSQSGCVATGGFAEGIDPEEGRLIQQLVGENCPHVNVPQIHGSTRHEVVPEDVSVLEIEHMPDGLRNVTLRILGRKADFSYNPEIAMVACRGLSKSEYLVHPSAILLERLSDVQKQSALRQQADIQKQREERQRKADIQRRQREKQRSAPLDATFPIRVTWDGMDRPLEGTIREVRTGANGTMAITLPGVLGLCTGEYTYTGDNVGTWSLKCPDDLTASGTFQSGRGAHGRGTDNQGRLITYIIDVGQ